MISTTARSVDHISDGVTLALPVAFPFFETTHLVVSKIDPAAPAVLIPLVETQDYVVTGGQPASGTVTLVAAVTVAWTIRISRVVPLTQLSQLLTQGPFSPATIERMADLLTMIAQQINDGEIVVSELVAGETNTAANVNTAGVGVYKTKTGVQFQFRGVKAGDGTIVVTLDAGTNEIRFTVGAGIPLASVTDAASAAGLAASVAAVAVHETRIDALELAPLNRFFDDFVEDALDLTRWINTLIGAGGVVTPLPTEEFGRIKLEATGAGKGNTLTTEATLCTVQRNPHVRFSAGLIDAVDTLFRVGLIDAGGTNHLLISYDYSRAADNRWAATVSRGGAVQTTLFGVATDLNVDHAFDIVFDGTNWTFYMDGVLKATFGEALCPADATKLIGIISLQAGGAAKSDAVIDHFFCSWTSPAWRLSAVPA